MKNTQNLIFLDSLSPEMFLTKICMVSSAGAEEARDRVEDSEELLMERCIFAVVCRYVVERVMVVGVESLGERWSGSITLARQRTADKRAMTDAETLIDGRCRYLSCGCEREEADGEGENTLATG
jgi:hypothetical protein